MACDEAFKACASVSIWVVRSSCSVLLWVSRVSFSVDGFEVEVVCAVS